MVSFIRRTIKDVRRITKRFDTTHSHQKSYADKHRGPIEFQVGDLVFLKVAPMKGVIRFSKREKLNPRCVGQLGSSKGLVKSHID